MTSIKVVKQDVLGYQRMSDGSVATIYKTLWSDNTTSYSRTETIYNAKGTLDARIVELGNVCPYIDIPQKDQTDV